MNWLFPHSGQTRTGLQACLVALMMAIVATGCSGGGGGGTNGLPDSPVGGVFPIPVVDDHGNNVINATPIEPGQGITTGFYNPPNPDPLIGEDTIDYFQFDLVANQWYGLQNRAHENGNYNQNPGTSDAYLFQLLDGSGSVAIPSTYDWGWPAPVLAEVPDIEGFRTMFQANYTGSHIYTRRSAYSNTIGAYAFKLATTQVARSYPLRSGSNIRSNILIIDDSGEQSYLRYDGGASGSTGISEFAFYEFGAMDITIGINVSLVYFLNDEGGLNDDPETGAWHIHWGVPSGDLSDGIDDALTGYFPNRNFQPPVGEEPHPSIFQGDFEVGSPDLFPLDIVNMMIGLQWYLDVHITNNLELYPFPIASSYPQAGVHMFDSTLILSSYDTSLGGSFPFGEGTGTGRSLEVVYDDEFQVFYLPYGSIRDHAALVGSTLHIHRDVNSSDGELLLDLGTIPPIVVRPIYEDFTTNVPQIGNEVYTRANVPGIENIILKLSDAQAKILNDATYTPQGWYLDLHTSPNYVNTPELRVNAILYGNLEVGAFRAP